MYRRSLLAGLATLSAVGQTGCLQSDDGPSHEITVINASPSDQTVRVTFQRQDRPSVTKEFLIEVGSVNSDEAVIGKITGFRVQYDGYDEEFTFPTSKQCPDGTTTSLILTIEENELLTTYPCV